MDTGSVLSGERAPKVSVRVAFRQQTTFAKQVVFFSIFLIVLLSRKNYTVRSEKKNIEYDSQQVRPASVFFLSFFFYPYRSMRDIERRQPVFILPIKMRRICIYTLHCSVYDDN